MFTMINLGPLDKDSSNTLLTAEQIGMSINGYALGRIVAACKGKNVFIFDTTMA
jgi:hypothetical protein